MPEDNDRITQAVLKTVVENNTKALERIDTRLASIDGCIRSLETRVSVVETKQDNLDKDIEKIDRKTNAWGGFNSLGAAVAGIIAWFR